MFFPTYEILVSLVVLLVSKNPMLGRIYMSSRKKLTCSIREDSKAVWEYLYSKYILKSACPEPDQFFFFFFYPIVIMSSFLTKAGEEVELCSESIIIWFLKYKIQEAPSSSQLHAVSSHSSPSTHKQSASALRQYPPRVLSRTLCGPWGTGSPLG